MRWIVAVQSLEVRAIERQDTAPFACGAFQNSLVVATLLASFLYSQHIVPRSPESFNDVIVEILVGIKEAHRGSGLCVPTDEALNLFSMRLVILPSCCEVVAHQTRNRSKDVLVAPTQSLPLNEAPNIDVRVTNAGFDTIGMRATGDAGCLGYHR
jgi:hypothetical protein